MRFESDCDVDPETMQFGVTVKEGDLPHLTGGLFELNFNYVCYDSLGEMVWANTVYMLII